MKRMRKTAVPMSASRSGFIIWTKSRSKYGSMPLSRWSHSRFGSGWWSRCWLWSMSRSWDKT